jgi:hypothetical protein
MKNIKIGIIIDKYHLEYKVTEFLKYLKSIAKVSFYVEESYLLNSANHSYEEELFFVKGKGDLILGFVKLIEEETSIPVINSYIGNWNAIHRFMHSTKLRKAGILIPDYSLNPVNWSNPFQSYIIKNIIDQKNYKFKPNTEEKNGQLRVSDQRALNEAEDYQYLLYQKFIQSKWEYKIYGIGEEQIYFHRQLPVLVNANKMESRREIDEIPELKEVAIKAMETLDLKISSIDFLKSKEGQYFLTDINCTPNFNYLKNGYKIVADYLLKQIKQ